MISKKLLGGLDTPYNVHNVHTFIYPEYIKEQKMSYEIKKLLPRHYKIMDLLLLGKKQKEIAREVNLSEQAVSSIVNSRIFKEQLPFRKKQVEQKPDKDGLSAGDLLHRALVTSAKRLCQMLYSEDDRVALRAAMDILDRAGYPKCLRTQITKRPKTAVIDDQVAKRLEQALRELEEQGGF